MYDNRRSAFDECGHVISFDCLDSTRKDVILLFDVYGLLIAGHLLCTVIKLASYTLVRSVLISSYIALSMVESCFLAEWLAGKIAGASLRV